MSSQVSFEGIGGVVATFYAEESVEVGQAVKVSGQGTVAKCSAEEDFCGVVVSVSDGCAGVQVGGLMEVPCSDGTVAPGLRKLVADGNGGVKAGEGGQSCWVVSTESDFITIKM